MTTQNRVDQSYPPTMTFNVKTLEPTNVLSQRVSIIRREFPEFFSGRRLLDVCCGQGWFSLAYANAFDSVIAFDSDSKSISLCREICVFGNVRFSLSTFRNFSASEQFDRVFIGNAHHHVFRELESHDWIVKLAALSSDEVLVEGPKSNSSCRDMAVYPDSFNCFEDRMRRYFEKVKEMPTVKYTPGRTIVLWRRLPTLAQATREIEKRYRRDDLTHSNRVSVFIAAESPISNGLLRFVDCGWVEEFSTSPICRYFEGEREILRRICDHQVYLSRLGYVELDPGTINFFKHGCVLFDKSAVVPISTLTASHVDAWQKLFRQSYKSIPKEITDVIVTALLTADSRMIEEAFRRVKTIA